MAEDVATREAAEIQELIRSVNVAWLEGEFDRLASVFHERIVFVDGQGRRLCEGRAACVDSYRAFRAEARVTHFREAETRVDVFGAVAIACAPFEIVYSRGGQECRERGQDIFAFERDGERWRAVWRQTSARPV